MAANMEAHKGDLNTTVREILQERSGAAATYTHIECKIGGLERAAMGIGTMIDWLKEHPQDSATYVFVNKADKHAALGNMTLDEGVTATKQTQGKLFVTTCYDFASDIQAPKENQERLIFLMDMGFGVRTGEVALAAINLLHCLQELLRGDTTGTTVLWISVSYLDEELLCEASGRRVGGLRLPHFNQPRLCHQDRAHEKADGPQRPDENWQSAAVGRILEEVVKDATWPVSVAFVMSIEDAHIIRTELATDPGCPSLAMYFINTWKASPVAEAPDGAPHDLKIVWVDPEISVIRPIENLKAVVVAPALRAYAFDINTTSVVRTMISCDHANAFASSIRDQGSEGAAVHMVNGFSHPAPVPNQRLCGFREEQAELSTASDRDFWCLSLAITATARDYQYPGIISVVIPPRFPKLDEAARRLDLWHLVDRSDLPPGVDPRIPRPPSLLASAAGATANFDLNIHSAVLLAHVVRDLPLPVKHALVDLAMLISQGPRAVLDHRGKAKGPQEHREIIRGLGPRAGSARKYCHKGWLWQSLAYLNYFRNMRVNEAWGLHDWPACKLYGVAMYHMLERTFTRSSRWRRELDMPRPDRASRLSSEEFELVEEILVSAFPFNLIRVHVDDVGYFGRDLTSDVVLDEEAQGETVHWELLKEEAKKSGHGLVMAIHSHLWMDVDSDDLRVYRATGVTAISASAFKPGLSYLGIDHFSSLRPLVKPERRCLIPASEARQTRQVDSSQDTTSTSNSSAA